MQAGIILFKKRRGQNWVVAGGQFWVDIPIMVMQLKNSFNYQRSLRISKGY
jgi:hypothetical protein